MSGTSADGGYILDTPPPIPLSADVVQRALQIMASQLSGLPGNLVRPRWQPMPPTQPDVSVTWAAIGVQMVEMDNFPAIVHIGGDALPGQTNPGYDLMLRQGTVTVICSFYGPEAEETAAAMRDALYLPMNIENLTPVRLKLYEVEDLTHLPEIINQQYVNRADIRIKFRVHVERRYPIFDLAGAQVTVTTDHGEVTTVNLP